MGHKRWSFPHFQPRKWRVDDIKRRKPFWIKSFSIISPEGGDGHIVKRNLAALVSLGLTSIEEKRRALKEEEHLKRKSPYRREDILDRRYSTYLFEKN